MRATGGAAALEMRKVGMRFGEVWVLQDVTLSVQPGSIHAIVGHNGAGKSTLMKIALGAYQPTTGEVWIQGRRLAFGRPAAARGLGVGMVLQERSLITTLSGLDNMFLNSEVISPLRVVNRAKEAAEASRLLEQLGVSKGLLRASVAQMTPIEQELLEIGKALRLADKVLILDEPTAPLGREEITRLFEVMRLVAKRGTGIVLITHHLAEVFAVSDEITCLREGHIVLSKQTTETSMAELIRAMLGRTSVAESLEPKTTKQADVTPAGVAHSERQPTLDVRKLQVGRKLLDVSFTVLPGEIVGIAGLAGSGRSTLLRTLFGDIRVTAGEVLLDGRTYKPDSPRQAIRLGVFLIPEDRGVHGLILTKNIVENIVLPILSRFASVVRTLQMSRARATAKDLMTRLDVRARGMDQVVGELSGGNQQKIVLAKALAANATLMLLDEPTFGVDIGTTREIIRQVRKLTERGTAVVWATSDMLELLQVADRVIVLRDGVIEGAIGRGEPGFDEDSILGRIQRTQFMAVS
jgi:ribose transport system ATP-binding protein